MAARRETPAEPEPSIPPEVATPLIHAMLDRHYRAALDEPVPMLGDVTPRAAARTKAGRDRLAAWLKHLENGSGRHSDPTDPMATYAISPGCGANSGSKTCVGDAAATVNPCPDNVRRPTRPRQRIAIGKSSRHED